MYPKSILFSTALCLGLLALNSAKAAEFLPGTHYRMNQQPYTDRYYPSENYYFEDSDDYYFPYGSEFYSGPRGYFYFSDDQPYYPRYKQQNYQQNQHKSFQDQYRRYPMKGH